MGNARSITTQAIKAAAIVAEGHRDYPGAGAAVGAIISAFNGQGPRIDQNYDSMLNDVFLIDTHGFYADPVFEQIIKEIIKEIIKGYFGDHPRVYRTLRDGSFDDTVWIQPKQNPHDLRLTCWDEPGTTFGKAKGACEKWHIRVMPSGAVVIFAFKDGKMCALKGEGESGKRNVRLVPYIRTHEVLDVQVGENGAYHFYNLKWGKYLGYTKASEDVLRARLEDDKSENTRISIYASH